MLGVSFFGCLVPPTWSDVADLATGAAALWAAWIAGSGLRTWREQHDAGEQRDAAKALLATVEQLYEAVDKPRCKFAGADAVSPPSSPTSLPRGEEIQARVFASSVLSEHSREIHAATMRVLDALHWASLAFDQETTDIPALPIVEHCAPVRKALDDVAMQLRQGTLPILPSGAWLKALAPEQRTALVSDTTPDPWVVEFARRRRALRSHLRPFIFFTAKWPRWYRRLRKR